MGVRLLHTGDVHLGHLRRNTAIPLEAKMDRYKGILQTIFGTARREKVNHVVIAGDIMDHKDTFPKIKDMFLEALLHYNDVSTVIIPGNHDVIEHGYTQLRYLRLLQEKGKLDHVIFTETRSRVVETVDTWFVLVPPVEDPGGYPAHVKGLVATIPETSKPIIVVSHETVAGVSDDSGYELKKGVRIPKLRRVTFWALGDIHKAQAIPGHPNAWYSGPPAQVKFGETADKGPLLVDLDDPTNPRTIRRPDIKSVRDLITVNSDDPAVLAEIPTEAWVSLQTSDVDAMKSVTANVVKVTPRKDNSKKPRVDVTNPLSGLTGWLETRMNLSKAESSEAFDMLMKMTEQ